MYKIPIKTEEYENTCLAIIVTDTNTGSDIDVGGIDELLATVTKVRESITLTSLPNSDESTETGWVCLVLTDSGVDTTILSFVTKLESTPVITTNADNVFASDITTEPAAFASYFIVSNSTNWTWFDNNADMNWAVFDTSLLP